MVSDRGCVSMLKLDQFITKLDGVVTYQLDFIGFDDTE